MRRTERVVALPRGVPLIKRVLALPGQTRQRGPEAANPFSPRHDEPCNHSDCRHLGSSLAAARPVSIRSSVRATVRATTRLGSTLRPFQKEAWKHKSFEYGAWGGEFRAEFVPEPGEIVATEHWCSSGFANTDLDLQLKKHGIHQLIVIGLIADTCIEATVRYAAELGYEVTVVKDAMADYSGQAASNIWVKYSCRTFHPS